MTQIFCFVLQLQCPLLVDEQKYPPSATTLHFEFYAEPGPEVKVERKVNCRIFMRLKGNLLECCVHDSSFSYVSPFLADQ